MKLTNNQIYFLETLLQQELTNIRRGKHVFKKHIDIANDILLILDQNLK